MIIQSEQARSMVLKFAALGALGALAALSSTAGTTSAQSQVRDPCRTNRTGDACMQAHTEQVRATYRLPSLARHRIVGDRVRQIFVMSENLPMVSFVSPRGGSAVVTVHYPRRRDGRTPPPLRAAVPAPVWREVLALSEPFDVPPSTAEPGTICLDGAAYLVEAVDPGRPAMTRRTLGHDCEPGPVPAYVQATARIALALFPPCARIDARHYGGPFGQFAACGMLHGDRLAAADVLNRAQGFRMTYNEQDRTRLAGLFSAGSELRWDGVRRMGDPAALWAARAAPVLGITRLTVEAVEGMDSGRVRLTGRLIRTAGTGASTQTAQVEQLWRRDPDGMFRVTRAIVGRWEEL